MSSLECILGLSGICQRFIGQYRQPFHQLLNPMCPSGIPGSPNLFFFPTLGSLLEMSMSECRESPSVPSLHLPYPASLQVSLNPSHSRFLLKSPLRSSPESLESPKVTSWLAYLLQVLPASNPPRGTWSTWYTKLMKCIVFNEQPLCAWYYSKPWR